MGLALAARDRTPTTPVASPQAVDDQQRRLFGLLARGHSVTKAARRLHLSQRTAERRLAEGRAILGATTNAEAVSRLRRPRNGRQQDPLTAREDEVLELVAEGLRDTEIAGRLGIVPSTVATLLQSSMGKLGARTRVEAVAKLAGIKDGRIAPISLVSGPGSNRES